MTFTIIIPLKLADTNSNFLNYQQTTNRKIDLNNLELKSDINELSKSIISLSEDNELLQQFQNPTSK